MTRRLRLGNTFGIESATDSAWVSSLILAACTLLAVTGRVLPSAPPAAVMPVGVAAAMGVFASLAVSSAIEERATPCSAVATKQRGVTTAGWHQGALES